MLSFFLSVAAVVVAAVRVRVQAVAVLAAS
jgi:hypothetical protein